MVLSSVMIPQAFWRPSTVTTRNHISLVTLFLSIPPLQFNARPCPCPPVLIYYPRSSLPSLSHSILILTSPSCVCSSSIPNIPPALSLRTSTSTGSHPSVPIVAPIFLVHYPSSSTLTKGWRRVAGRLYDALLVITSICWPLPFAFLFACCVLGGAVCVFAVLVFCPSCQVCAFFVTFFAPSCFCK